ncbi:MAG: hypothetical protein V4663_04585 [Bacteroidota bacterium]
MKHFLFSIIVLTFYCLPTSAQNGFKWNLNPYHGYPTYVDLQAESRGFVIDDDKVTVSARNLSNSTITCYVKFTFTDFCGKSTIQWWPAGVTLKSGESTTSSFDINTKCKEIKKDGDRKTGIASVMAEITNFKNLTEEANKVKEEKLKKEQLIAENAKKEQDRIAKMKEAKNTQTKMGSAEGQKAHSSSTNSTSGTKSNSYTQANTSTSSTGSNTNSDFWNDKPATSKNNSQAADSKPKQPTSTEIMAGVKKQTDDFWSDKKASDTKIEQQTSNRIKNINDAIAVRESRDNLNESTSLKQTYATVESLMQDFNLKMSQIKNQVNTLTENNKAEFNSRVDNSFNGPKDAGINAGLKIIGGIVNDAKEKKEREYYKEKLEKEKNEKLKEIETTKRRMLTNVRQQLFSEFKEGKLPLSSSNINAATVYFFFYAYDPARLSYEAPTLYVSNVFPISQYSDGTWPFKANILSEITGISPYEERLNGYYMSEEEGKALMTGMVDIFKQTGGNVESVAYKGKSATSSGKSSEDFWGKEKKATKPTDVKTTPVKKENFWNN